MESNYIKKSEFLISVAKKEDVMKTDLPQIAVVGKSNVGKSSFINFLAGNTKLARVSKTPGRTRFINYFKFNEGFILVDLPGYGYAKASVDEKNKWKDLVDGFFNDSNDLKHVLLLVDLRHDLTENDLIMYNFLFRKNLPFSVVATKSDKLPKSKVKNQVNHLAAILKLGSGDIIPISAQAGAGKTQIIEKLKEVLKT